MAVTCLVMVWDQTNIVEAVVSLSVSRVNVVHSEPRLLKICETVVAWLSQGCHTSVTRLLMLGGWRWVLHDCYMLVIV
jgi:hypothetical protein